MIVIRLYRVLPLAIALAVIALVAYLVISYLRSPLRAKEVLIAVFSRLSAVGAAGCLLVTAYALLDGNGVFAELSGCCALIFLLALAVVLVCRAVFLRNHPEYRDRAEKARLIGRGAGRKR